MRIKSSRIGAYRAFVIALLATAGALNAQSSAEPVYPARVLITNDNGIDDPKIIALARAFSQHSETWIVAPNQDRSGTGSYMSVTRQGFLEAERRDVGAGIEAFAVDGYPADCVLLALLGPMQGRPPDLVISGINSGENLGPDWFGSGTVGAARVAAIAGVPSLAISGLDDDIPGAVDAVVAWVLRLAGSDLVRDMEPLSFLTVSLPRTSPDEILGVRVTDRAPLRVFPTIAAENDIWRIVGQESLDIGVPPDSDQAAWDAGYIAVVPMRVDEVDLELLARWRREQVEVAPWP